MNTTNEQADKLTRRLMEGTAEQPSASLNARIMALIMGEKRAALRRCYMKKLPSPGAIFAGLAVYMMAVAGLVMLFTNKEGADEGAMEVVKHLSPLLLTVSSCVSIFFFFAQLDNWLRVKERKRERG